MLTVDIAVLSACKLKDCVDTWKTLRKQGGELKKATHEATHGHFVALVKFFGETPLKEITPGQLVEYQDARAENRIVTPDGEIHPWKRKAGRSCINHELTGLSQLLDFCGLWAPLALYYKPLWIPPWSPAVIPDEDQEADLFEKVKGHPEAEIAYWVACITNNTSAAGCELRGLRMRDVIFREPTIGKDGEDKTPSLLNIPAEIVKNFNRPRVIPLNREALWAIRQCYQRALQCGSTKPHHCLFPKRIKIGKWDPEQPASRSWLRKSWAHLRRISGLPDLNPHDIRHLMMTRSLEGGMDPETLRALAGHVNPKMTQYYAHHRIGVKYAAVCMIERNRTAAKKPVARAAVVRMPRVPKESPRQISL